MKSYRRLFEQYIEISLCYNIHNKHFYFETSSGWTSPETDKSGIIQELRDLDTKVVINNHDYEFESILDIISKSKENNKIKVKVNSSKFGSYYK
jgi:hypothetical protein